MGDWGAYQYMKVRELEDQLRRLRAENERLRRERDDYRERWETLGRVARRDRHVVSGVGGVNKAPGAQPPEFKDQPFGRPHWPK